LQIIPNQIQHIWLKSHCYIYEYALDRIILIEGGVDSKLHYKGSSKCLEKY
jgi:hypothetical protein